MSHNVPQRAVELMLCTTGWVAFFKWGFGVEKSGIGLPFSSIGWPTFAVCRNIPLKEEENFSTLIAIAFTVPLVLVASGLAGGELTSSLQSCLSKQPLGWPI